MKRAEYKCIKCNYRYISDPGPTTCPQCGSLYVEWTNYIKDFQR